MKCKSYSIHIIFLNLDLHLYLLTLAQGQTYCTKVRACNRAGLCTEVTSDGVTPDFTPPVMGHVLDGVTGEDLVYQSSRYMQWNVIKI